MRIANVDGRLGLVTTDGVPDVSVREAVALLSKDSASK